MLLLDGDAIAESMIRNGIGVVRRPIAIIRLGSRILPVSCYRGISLVSCVREKPGTVRKISRIAKPFRHRFATAAPTKKVPALRARCLSARVWKGLTRACPERLRPCRAPIAKCGLRLNGNHSKKTPLIRFSQRDELAASGSFNRGTYTFKLVFECRPVICPQTRGSRCAGPQILLILKVLIGDDQQLKSVGFAAIEKFAVADSFAIPFSTAVDA